MYEGGWPFAHVRTERGEAVIDHMKDRGDLVAHPVNRSMFLNNTRDVTTQKKRAVFIRFASRQKKGLPVPEFGFDLPCHERDDYRREMKFQATVIERHFKRAPCASLADLFATWRKNQKIPGACQEAPVPEADCTTEMLCQAIVKTTMSCCQKDSA